MINHVVVLAVFGVSAACGGVALGLTRGAGWPLWASLLGAAASAAAAFAALATLHARMARGDAR